VRLSGRRHVVLCAGRRLQRAVLGRARRRAVDAHGRVGRAGAVDHGRVLAGRDVVQEGGCWRGERVGASVHGRGEGRGCVGGEGSGDGDGLVDHAGRVGAGARLVLCTRWRVVLQSHASARVLPSWKREEEEGRSGATRGVRLELQERLGVRVGVNSGAALLC